MTKTLLYVIGISPNKIGGIERFARELAVQMKDCGWKLVVCFETPPTERLRKYFDASNLFIEVINNQSAYGFGQYLQLVRLILRYRPSVLVYSFNGVLRFIPWIAALLGVRTLFYNDHTSRPYQSLPPRPRAWKRAVGRLITYPLDGVICVSDFVSQCERQEQWVRPAKIHTIYNGVDVLVDHPAQGQAVQFRQKHGIAENRKIIISVSWLVPEKGIDTFLQAARLVIRAEPLAHFVIVGTGYLHDEYRKLSVELGIERYITWTGALEDPTHAGAFAVAQVACQLSRWQEAFGLTITEAMACGIPVIGTRTGGIPEIVRDGANGFLVPIGDAQSTSERILDLLQNSPLREELGNAARSDVERKFDVRKTAQAYLQILGITHPQIATD